MTRESITLDLPLPPGVNALWRTYQGRMLRSAAYIAWLKEAGWEAKAQLAGFPTIDCAASVDIRIGPCRATRDADGCVKPTLDLLEHIGVIANDNLFDAGSFRRDPDVSRGRIIVTVARLA